MFLSGDSGPFHMKRLFAILVCSTLATAVCVNGHPSVEDEYSKSEYVLTASVVSASEVSESKDGYYVGGTDYTLRSLRILRGHPPTTFTVFSENSSGRFHMTAKKRYLVFVHWEHGKLRIDNCGNSGPLDAQDNKLADVLRLAGKLVAK
jgi:hypothetical protein